MSKQVVAREKFTTAGGATVEAVLFDDKTTGCDCDNFLENNSCIHTRDALKKWVSEGRIPGVGVGAPAAAPAAPAHEALPAEAPAPPAPVAPVKAWRPATPEEAERYKYHSAKAGAKKPLPPHIRKIPTGRTEKNNKGEEFQVMRVEIFDDVQAGAPETVQATAMVPAGNGAKPVRANGLPTVETVTAIVETDFYEVPRYNRRTRQNMQVLEPSARVWGLWAIEGGITCEYVRDKDGRPMVGADATKAWAVVRGKKGSLVREASVTLIFAVEEARLTIDKLNERAKAIKDARIDKITEPAMIEFFLNEATGLPVITDPLEQIGIIAQAFRKRTFGEREATTKAERIVQRKLLGAEFQDDDEVRSEAAEVDQVAALQGAPPAPPPKHPGAGVSAAASAFPSA